MAKSNRPVACNIVMGKSDLITEKLSQAKAQVKRSGIGAWVIFVRETCQGSDPCLPLILEGSLTWLSALIVSGAGETVAIVGNYDADPLIDSGNWDKVVPYVQDIKPHLLEVLESCVPHGAPIGLNYSLSDDKADGITHGMWLLFQSMLEGTRFEGSTVSAENVAKSLRSQKSQEEIRRIKAAIAEGDRLFQDIARFAKKGVSEAEVQRHVHQIIAERGLGFAWDPVGDPIVNSGPESSIGHGIPSENIRLEEGHVFHVDLGVQSEGYCSDVQRCWFVGDAVPNDVVQALQAVNNAIDSAAATLLPGVQGWQVDKSARDSIVASGYEEYHHAVGHQVGRLAHDGGTTLAPRWARYGDSPYGQVQENEVYTLELGVVLKDRGYIGIEEMVVVTPDGCEYLTERQLTMPLVGR